MTDAAISVTQSAVERFTEQYLISLGCSIEKRGNRWEVVVPEEVNTELSTGQFVLLCDRESSEIDETTELLHAESSFFQKLLTEASKRNPVGKIVLDTEGIQVEIPAWLRKSSIDVNHVNFTPYYDRTAVVLLFQVSIETVSEYQQEFLRAVALDVRSTNRLPGLEETFLGLTSPEIEPIESDALETGKEWVAQLIDEVRETVVNQVQPQIDEIHQEASRAADAEVEEYRQMQQQRIEELEEKAANLSSQIANFSQSIHQNSNQEARVQSLKKRKELKSEHDDIESEFEEIRQRHDQGFPEKQQEIRNRHALEVVVTPLTITQLEYERGEIELELTEGTTSQTLTVGYGSGVGVTETVHCDSCDQALTEKNPLQSIKSGLLCQQCR